MDKSRFYIIMCCLCICTTTLLAQNAKKKTVSNRCSFIEKKAINSKDYWLLKSLPNSPTNVVKSPESAAMIAYVYVGNLYGEKIAKIEQPYFISVLNDSLWMVSGTSKPRNKYKQWKGSFSLIIEKKRVR